MCTARSYSPPPAPEPVKLPEAPSIPNIVAPVVTQAAPGKPKEAPGGDVLFKRRGKKGMLIQMGAAPGTNIPGA